MSFITSWDYVFPAPDDSSEGGCIRISIGDVNALEEGPSSSGAEVTLLPRCPVSILKAVLKKQKETGESAQGVRPSPAGSQSARAQTLSVNGVKVAIGSSSDSDEEEEEEEEESSTEEEDIASMGTALPTHGMVLELVDLALMERAPFQTVLKALHTCAIPKGKFSRRFIVLGYHSASSMGTTTTNNNHINSSASLYLLPEPVLVPVHGASGTGEHETTISEEKGATAGEFRFQPLPVIILEDLSLLLGLSFSDVTTSAGVGVGKITQRMTVMEHDTTNQLAAETIQSPPLHSAPLRQVFRVEADREYLLTSINRYVIFVGVAGGLPWVQFRCSPIKLSAATPLALCHSEKDLLERFQLCDATEVEALIDNVAGASTAKGEVEGAEEEGAVGAAAAEAEEDVPTHRHQRAPSYASSAGAGTGSGRGTPRVYTPRRQCVLGKRTSSPRPPAYTTTATGPTVTVTGPYGNQIHCVKDARQAFLLSFPDRLVGREGVPAATWRRLFSVGGKGSSAAADYTGRAATVMGLYNNDLVLLFDGDQKASIFRSRVTREEIQKAFSILPPDHPPPPLTASSPTPGTSTARRSSPPPPPVSTSYQEEELKLNPIDEQRDHHQQHAPEAQAVHDGRSSGATPEGEEEHETKVEPELSSDPTQEDPETLPASTVLLPVDHTQGSGSGEPHASQTPSGGGVSALAEVERGAGEPAGSVDAHLRHTEQNGWDDDDDMFPLDAMKPPVGQTAHPTHHEEEEEEGAAADKNTATDASTDGEVEKQNDTVSEEAQLGEGKEDKHVVDDVWSTPNHPTEEKMKPLSEPELTPPAPFETEENQDREEEEPSFGGLQLDDHHRTNSGEPHPKSPSSRPEGVAVTDTHRVVFPNSTATISMSPGRDSEAEDSRLVEEEVERQRRQTTSPSLVPTSGVRESYEKTSGASVSPPPPPPPSATQFSSLAEHDQRALSTAWDTEPSGSPELVTERAVISNSPPPRRSPLPGTSSTLGAHKTGSVTSTASSSVSTLPTYQSTPYLNFLKAFAILQLRPTTVSEVTLTDVTTFYKRNLDQMLMASERYAYHCRAASSNIFSTLSIEETVEYLMIHEN